MAAEVRWLTFLVLAFQAIHSIVGDIPHKRFEYKYSFKPPYLAQRDATVPFWEYGGNAIASEENVRVAPSLRSQKGGIWTKSTTNFDWWEVELVFRVTGRGRIGADGLAFWYTADKGNYDGKVFGSSDKWVGLGIFFDSFDNDNKHNNPHISAILNDGTREFDHQNDGSTQLLAGCLRDFRNKPFPTRAKIEYYHNTLMVLFHNGMTNNEQDFEVCFRSENVFLPKNGFFGVTAATGGLADDHDVLKFLTYSLHSKEEMAQSPPQSGEEDEQRKLTQEYQDYQKKLELQKEKYKQEHPDEVHRKDSQEFDEWFETDQQRELSQIFAGQSKMFDVMRDLNRKLDEVVGRQERTLSLLSSGQAMQPVQGGHPPPPGGQIPMVDTIRRHEVDAVLANQREMVATIREVKAFVGEVHQRTASILQNQGKPVAHVQPVGAGGSFDFQQLSNEFRDSLNSLKRDMSVVANAQKGGCPTQQPCLSTTVFLIFLGIQLVILIGYYMYRDSKEAQAKKFF
ncbi:protein ERGIC-53 [Ischnura elegans]|uniref:protein ERGIC-53 n=1 Tax=Ischnura elegans TaxID=197161 RepID=UPI001ED88C10|nr:protein ERGIC-53 [Ischnura elegans]